MALERHPTFRPFLVLLLASCALLALPAARAATAQAHQPPHPVNLRQRWSFVDPLTNRIRVHYSFDSSTGDLADLQGVTIREWLRVEAPCERVIQTSAGELVQMPWPFTVILRREAAGPETWQGASGAIDDGHGTYPTYAPYVLQLVPPLGMPFLMHADTSWEVQQTFQWSSDGLSWHDMHSQPLVTRRRVSGVAFGALWLYTQVVQFRGKELRAGLGLGGMPYVIPCT